MNKKFWMILGASALVLGMMGCGSESKDENSLTAKEAALTAADVPEISAADMNKFGDALNAFGSAFEHAYGKAGSYVFSPFSYHSALSMTAYGAKGATYDEMAQALHLEGDKPAAAALNGGMRLKLRYDGQNEKSLFEIANRIWVDQSSEVVPAFSDAMDNYYKASLKVVDFEKDYNRYVGVINTWVSNNTGGMIKNLLKTGDLSSSTRMVLVNAIHFDGEWAQKFEFENTYDAKFKVSDGEQTDVRMMNLEADSFVYYRSDEHKYQTASMDYAGGDFAMMIVLPDEVDGLKDVAGTLDAAELRKIMDGQAAHNGNILLPKFKIETEVDGGANQKVFAALGVKLAFSGAADFSDMISNQAVYIDRIIHKAVIEVDEEGTKAAAATAVMMAEGMALPPDDFIDFRADHPFEFVLYHKASGAVLFAGQDWGK